MTIPKIFHYCWFGNNEKPDLALECINTWNKYSQYKIIEWNESNCDIRINKYVTDAYNDKAWAYVSDFFRLKALYDNGGIYLDTDVKIFKDFEPFLNERMFLGFMFDCTLGTAVIGAEKHNPVIKNLLDLYDNLTFSRAPNNDLYTKWFLENKNIKLNNTKQTYLDFTIYPKEYFECPTYDQDKGYSAHYFMGSWYPRPNLYRRIRKKILLALMGEVRYHQWNRKKLIPLTPWHKIYLEHIKEVNNG
jgi:mannosyltransferase OCH1-like enzyme